MIVPTELKVNAHKQVKVPTARELYKQYGFAKTVDPTKYTGDEDLDPSLSKVQGAKLAMDADAELAKQADAKEE